MSNYKNLAAIGLAAMLSFGLVACGGGGGGGSELATGDGTPAVDPAIAERAAIQTALDAVQTAVTAVDNESTDAQVSDAETAVGAAKSAIAAAVNVPAAETAANSGTVAVLETQLSGAKTARMDAMDDAQKTAYAAMMVTAVKLHAGIGAPAATLAAEYNEGGMIVVTRAVGINAPLSEDKTATVADNHGWEGVRYTATVTAEGDDGTYEAVVYSNIADPTPGKKFSDEYGADDDTRFAMGILGTATTEGDPSRVASPSFDQSAGVKAFKKGDNDIAVMIPGSFHGVPGTYSCIPPESVTCAVSVATSGFALGGIAGDNDEFTAGTGEWMFKPTNPDALVMSSPDNMYASYGWWLHKAANGSWTASAFADDKGGDAADIGIVALRGTATYMGGAAGKYALSSSIGGTNDAGHFTAKATLEADFSDEHMISGTIDTFMGADGMARNWSVELKEGGVDGTTGNITGETTAWTIGETAAADSGQWSGALKDLGADGVPKVATGTFYTEYGTDGKMVGAFGANKDEDE